MGTLSSRIRQERLEREQLHLALDHQAEEQRRNDAELEARFKSRTAVEEMMIEMEILSRNESWQDICNRESLYMSWCDYLLFAMLTQPELFEMSTGRMILFGLHEQVQQGRIAVKLENEPSKLHQRMEEILISTNIILTQRREEALDDSLSAFAQFTQTQAESSTLSSFSESPSSIIPTESSSSTIPNEPSPSTIPDESLPMTEEDYLATMRKLSFAEAELNLDEHEYSKEQCQIRPRRQLTRIARELATLSRTMPISSTALAIMRVSHLRSDFLSFMLTGPVGTPYEHGCFIFDLYLPPTYPNVPPKCWLRTTGNRRVRFNPNLYSNGKVCLSLLGTWSGPRWDPEHSTILQVLNSLQALVLVENPFYNEPYYEVSPENDIQSRIYNFGAGVKTIRYAILSHLLRIQGGIYSPFDEVILLHLRTHRHAILDRAIQLLFEIDKLRAMDDIGEIDKLCFSMDDLQPLINLR